VTELLRAWGLPSDPAVLIVAELAANAATHGRVQGRDFDLTLYVIGDTLRIEVTDTRAERLPRTRRPAADDESGRGLLLVEALADRWGTAPGRPPRKTIWAEVDLRQAPAPAPAPSDACFGGTGCLFPRTQGRKNPHQAPPLPPAEQAHPRG
jgi:hypothetical protein